MPDLPEQCPGCAEAVPELRTEPTDGAGEGEAGEVEAKETDCGDGQNIHQTFGEGMVWCNRLGFRLDILFAHYQQASESSEQGCRGLSRA